MRVSFGGLDLTLEVHSTVESNKGSNDVHMRVKAGEKVSC